MEGKIVVSGVTITVRGGNDATPCVVDENRHRHAVRPMFVGMKHDCRAEMIGERHDESVDRALHRHAAPSREVGRHR